MKIPVNLSIEEEVWKKFQTQFEGTGMTPSVFFEFVMRGVNSPGAAGIEKMLEGMFGFLMKKEKELDKKKK